MDNKNEYLGALQRLLETHYRQLQTPFRTLSDRLEALEATTQKQSSESLLKIRTSAGARFLISYHQIVTVAVFPKKARESTLCRGILNASKGLSICIFLTHPWGGVIICDLTVNPDVRAASPDKGITEANKFADKVADHVLQRKALELEPKRFEEGFMMQIRFEEIA